MLLAINTAFITANIGLYLDNGEMAVKSIDSNCKHSENVLKSIDELCHECEVSISEVTEIAVVVGPGSFTGIRIGVAIAKALGSVNGNLKIIPISSLDLMAYIMSQRKFGKKFVCVLNALSNLYFVANYDENGIKIGEERMIDKQALEEITDQLITLKNDLPNLKSEEIEICSEDLLKFALKLMTQNMFTSVENLAPVYLRPSQAEANLKND